MKGECSVTCGKGIVTFTRNCLKGICVGESTKTEDCEAVACAGILLDYIPQFKYNFKITFCYILVIYIDCV